MRKAGLLALLALLPAGCAAYPDQVEPAYVSPLIYRDLNCAQISTEMDRVKREVESVSGEQLTKATSDAFWVGAAALFIPVAVLGVATGSDQAAHLASLKGHWGALYRNYSDRECILEKPAG